MSYHPLQLTFDRLRKRALLAHEQDHEIVIFDPWTPNNLRAFTASSTAAQQMDSGKRFIYRSPVVQLKRTALLGKLNAQKRKALDLGWLPKAIGYDHRAVIMQPAIRRYQRLHQEQRHFHDRENILLDGSVAIAAVSPRSLVITVRKKDGIAPAAASVQLTGSLTGAVEGCMQRSLEGRLVAYLGTTEDLGIALDNLYNILSYRHDDKKTSRLVDHVRNAEPLNDTFESYGLAGMPGSDEARYFAPLYREKVPGVRIIRSYAMPLRQSLIKSRKLQAG